MRLALLGLLVLAPVVAGHGSVGPEIHVVAREGGFAFEPFEYTVAVGLPVAWTDESGAAHAVASVASPREEEPDGRLYANVTPRGTTSVDPGAARDVFYRCTLHGMRGVLHVVAAAPALPPALVAFALALTVRARRPSRRP